MFLSMIGFPIDEMVILEKFHKDRATTVDFLKWTIFEAVQLFIDQPCFICIFYFYGDFFSHCNW